MSDVPYGSGSQRTWAPGEAHGGAGQDTAAQGTAGQHTAGQGSGGVKERVAETASQVGDAGRETAQDAKERARDVAHEATDRARGLAERARTELGSQAGTQQQKLAGGIRTLGDELSQMAGGTQDPGYASELVERAGDATKRVAQWFEDREPAAVLHEVEDFARRRPGLFLAVAAGAGLLVGRFLRGAKEVSSDDSGTAGSSTAGSTAAPTVPYAAPTAPTPAPAFPPANANGAQPQTFGGDSDVRNA